jgi:amino acid transporter
VRRASVAHERRTVMGQMDVDRDVQKLAELGYRQELTRAWSGFTNFAISFTIISVLAGVFTNFGFAWTAGGPAGIAWGWPILCAFVLLVAFSMSELTSAYPTAGGPYWWAAKLGGPGWSWFTGWFNMIGLVGIVAGVGYGAAIFLNAVLSIYGVTIGGINFATGNTSAILHHQFVLFLMILFLYTVINIFADPLLALFNNISVGWHVVGVLLILGILLFVPDHHQDAGFVFGHKINNTGFHGGATGGLFFWLYVLPIGFILTMYTQTGYDASAHTAEETRGAALAAAKGVWRSVFYSAILGWFLLLMFLFSATDTKAVSACGCVPTIFSSSMHNHLWGAKLILIIATVGQLFCGAAGLTSASRTWYAFSRDRGMPGWRVFRRLNQARVPLYAVLAVSVASLLITIPAYWGTNGVPFAYFAITAICTVGLYLAYIIPVYLRLRQGDNFQPGPWSLGRHYKWINTGAIVFVVLVVYALDIPFSSTGVPWNSGWKWSSLNYSPLVLLVGVVVAVWWVVGAKNKYTGPVRTIDEAPMDAAPETSPAPTPAS